MILALAAARQKRDNFLLACQRKMSGIQNGCVILTYTKTSTTMIALETAGQQNHVQPHSIHTRTPHAPVSLGRDVMSEASLPTPRHGHAFSSGEATFRPVFTRLDQDRTQDAKKKKSTQTTPHKASQRRLRCREIGRSLAREQKIRESSAKLSEAFRCDEERLVAGAR